MPNLHFSSSTKCRRLLAELWSAQRVIHYMECFNAAHDNCTVVRVVHWFHRRHKDLIILMSRVEISLGNVDTGVTERNDSRRILTRDFFFYLEKWPPINILLQLRRSYFYRRKFSQTGNSTVSWRKVTSVELPVWKCFWKVEIWPFL
jgi:hypothetical protein